jgi:hypothetical protein
MAPNRPKRKSDPYLRCRLVPASNPNITPLIETRYAADATTEVSMFRISTLAAACAASLACSVAFAQASAPKSREQVKEETRAAQKAGELTRPAAARRRRRHPLPRPARR